MKEFLPENETSADFLNHLYYESIQTSEEQDYYKLKERIEGLQKKLKAPGNIIFYLSTPPNLYPVIPKHLATVGLNKQKDGF